MRALLSQLSTPSLNYPCYCTPILSSMPAPPAQLAVALTSTFSAHTSPISWDITSVYSAQLRKSFYFLLTKNLQIPHNTLKFQLVLLLLNQNPSLGPLLENNNLLINHMPQNCTISCAELGAQGEKKTGREKKKARKEEQIAEWTKYFSFRISLLLFFWLAWFIRVYKEGLEWGFTDGIHSLCLSFPTYKLRQYHLPPEGSSFK